MFFAPHLANTDLIADRITGLYRANKYLSEKCWFIKNKSELSGKSSSENVFSLGSIPIG
jgi:hypothetical protein